MIHVKRNTVIPAAFKSAPIREDIKKYREFFKRSAKSRSQEGFNEVVNGDTVETLKAVVEQFKYKCATCEMKLSLNTVICDSWRPRSNAKGFNEEFGQDHYWWLAYNWDNKYALCANCNKFKGTWFPLEGNRAAVNASYVSVLKTEKPLLIDPCHDYPEEHFVVDDDGKLLHLTKKGEITIEILKLNRKDLLQSRKSTINAVKNTLHSIESLWSATKKNSSNLNQQKVALRRLHELYTQISDWLKRSPDEDFVMVRRQVAITWLYLKPEYRNLQGLKSVLPKCIKYSAFKELENMFRNFQRIITNKSNIPLGYKPLAIIKPDITYISKQILPQESNTKKTAAKKAAQSTPALTPTTTLSTTIKEGLKIISSIVGEPLTNVVAESAAKVLQNIEKKRVVRLYPERIEIKNFKSIASLRFDFKVPAPDTKILGVTIMSHKEPWKFLLGENGVGKSTILQAIALVLAGESYIKSLNLNPDDLLRHGTKTGTVKIWFSGSSEPAVLTITPAGLSCNFETGKINVLGYGSTRVLPKKNTSLQPEHHTSSVKIRNLFDYSVSLSDVKKWLLEIDQKSFDQVARALKDVMDLPSVKTYFIRKGDQIFFSEKKETVDQLSEGYRSVLALAVDIMKTLSEDTRQNSSNPKSSVLAYEAMEGIVLIDEISSHLHPRWQMKIVKSFRKAFPKLQFVVTSHDPLSLKGIESGEVLLLKKDENDKVVGIEDLPNPAELRAEQLLTSEFFGLSSTLDPELEVQFNTYHYLLAKQSRTNDEETQLQNLKISLKEKQHLGDSLREELMYEVIDSSLAKYGQNMEQQGRKELLEETKTQVFDLWDKIYKK